LAAERDRHDRSQPSDEHRPGCTRHELKGIEMRFKKSISMAMASIALAGAVPALATGIGHSFFMRGSIIGKDTTGTIVCVGKADGATVGQVLDVYRVKTLPGSGYKGSGPAYRRDLIGHVRVDHIFDDHFAHVSVADGAPAVHDIVELRKK
ncbi:hypothetical protein RAD15_43700, partial [Bradyrhizobium sp. 14AA]